MTRDEMRRAMRAAVMAAPEVERAGGKRWIADVRVSHEELLAAARMGVVELCRCDLASAYDAGKQATSEMRYLNGVFHFVRLT